MEPNEIRNQIRELIARQSEAAKDNDAQAANELQGRINALNEILDLAIARQDEVIANLKTVNNKKNEPKRLDIVSQFLGARADYDPSAIVGERVITMPTDAVTITGPGTQPAGVPQIDPNLPLSPAPIAGFYATLMQGTTEGPIEFFQKTTNVNSAAQWSGTGAKAESNHGWEAKVANLAWVAHHTPITKTMTSDYGQMQSAIQNEMMMGLGYAKSREALTGSNTNGIVGVLNTAGIQTFTKKTNDNIFDTIRRQATTVRRNSGFMPTHVAMSAVAKEEMDLLKSDDKQYLMLNLGNTVWSLRIVEDDGLEVADKTTETTLHEGTLVYAPVGATWYTKEVDNMQIGLVGNQFIENAFTLLAEGRHALAVKYPKAFSYCSAAASDVTA